MGTMMVQMVEDKDFIGGKTITEALPGQQDLNFQFNNSICKMNRIHMIGSTMEVEPLMVAILPLIVGHSNVVDMIIDLTGNNSNSNMANQITTSKMRQ